VGVAGVSGNGQQELAQVICGLRSVENGTVAVGGSDVTNTSSAAIRNRGVSYIPEERMIDGIVKDFSVAENYVLRDYEAERFTRRGVFMDFASIDQGCQEAIRAYEIKTPGTSTKIKNLSGGNIQKLILARELARGPRLLIAAQPTRGVDIGAMEYIHHRLLDERAKGTAVLLISEDLDEILLLADRIVVMFEGAIVGEVRREDVVLEELGALMAGTRSNT
jgi:simple sugar transport system ATP-binding protein